MYSSIFGFFLVCWSTFPGWSFHFTLTVESIVGADIFLLAADADFLLGAVFFGTAELDVGFPISDAAVTWSPACCDSIFVKMS